MPHHIPPLPPAYSLCLPLPCPVRVLKKCRFYTCKYMPQSTPNNIYISTIYTQNGQNINMTYKSTTFKTKINVDSTLMKYLNLQPTFLAPPS